MTERSKAVFLSYASQDADAARHICEALRAAGIEVWFDQSELRGGDAWDAAIRRQIKTCGLFIPVISTNTHAREEGYFRLEWKLAVDRSHLMAESKAFLLPVVIDGTRDDDERTPDKLSTNGSTAMDFSGIAACVGIPDRAVVKVRPTSMPRFDRTDFSRQLESKFADAAAYDIGTAHAYRGEADAAITWQGRAYRQRRGSGMELLKVDPLLRNLRSDPRYKVLLHKMNLPD